MRENGLKGHDRLAVETLIREAGLEDHMQELFECVYPSVRLFTERVREDEIPPGSSKIGGRPDVPAGFRWPRDETGEYLSFICQLNGRELAALPVDPLPRDGMLYFFYSASKVWDEGGWLRPEAVVFHAPDPRNLVRMEIPDELAERWRYDACTVTMKPEWTVPPGESSLVARMGIPFDPGGEVYSKYAAFHERFQQMFGGQDVFSNRLLGHPDQMQNDLQRQAAAFGNGMFGLESDPVEWRLLLQIDSEEAKTGMMWGDCGKLYFMIRHEDLVNRVFDRCVPLLQW